MKIGLVLARTPVYSETFFLSKIKGLKASGFEVTLFAQQKEGDFSLCTVKLAPKVYKKNSILQLLRVSVVLLKLVITFPKRLFKLIKLDRNANRTWVQIVKNLYNNSHILSSDLNWLHFGFATIALQSEHVAKAIGAKMAVSFRGFDLDVYPKEHPNCYMLLFREVDKIHSISNYLLQQGYQLGLSKEKPFSIITPAIDISLFKNESSIIAEQKSFLTVARLHPIKGLKDSIKAMGILSRNSIEFNYIIVGEGQDYNDLLDLIKALDLSEHVHLIGKQSHSRIIEYMKTSQVYIQYSESEGFCNAVLEAQAMGLLCIVSDGGALPENVINTKTGWIVEKKQPEKLAEKILEVITLPKEVRLKVTDCAQERVRQDFNLEKQQKEFAEFYKQTL